MLSLLPMITQMMIFHHSVQAGFTWKSLPRSSHFGSRSFEHWLFWLTAWFSLLSRPKTNISINKTIKFYKTKIYFLIIDAGMKMFMGKKALLKILCEFCIIYRLDGIDICVYIFQLEFINWYAEEYLGYVVGLCWRNICEFLC